MEGLRRRFADVGPSSAGAPTDNELVLVARQKVLRLLALHEAPGAAELATLADDLATAERAAVGFRARLEQAIPRLGQRATIDSALILSLLLRDRWFAVAADDGAEASEWIEALWSAVQREEGAAYAGAAVVAATVDGEVREIGRRYAESSAELARVERERTEVAARWKRESRLHRIRRGLRLSPWLFAPVAVAALVLEQVGNAMTAVAVCAVAVSVWGLGQISAAVVGLFSSSRHGFATAVQAAQARSNRLRELAERLGPETDRLRTELEALRGTGRGS